MRHALIQQSQRLNTWLLHSAITLWLSCSINSFTNANYQALLPDGELGFYRVNKKIAEIA